MQMSLRERKQNINSKLDLMYFLSSLRMEDAFSNSVFHLCHEEEKKHPWRSHFV